MPAVTFESLMISKKDKLAGIKRIPCTVRRNEEFDMYRFIFSNDEEIKRPEKEVKN